jgi:predicted ABC-type sugar transport system permease subunit
MACWWCSRVLFIACVIFVPNFGSFINMKGLGLAISMSGMVACGMLFCLASGDFDLSVASVIACAGVTAAVVINMTESLWIGVFAGLLLGHGIRVDQRLCYRPAENKRADHHPGHHANIPRVGIHHFRRESGRY